MWPNPQFPADLITFTEEIFDGKLHFHAVCVKWRCWNNCGSNPVLKRSRLEWQRKWRSGIFTPKIKGADNQNVLDSLQSCFLFQESWEKVRTNTKRVRNSREVVWKIKKKKWQSCVKNFFVQFNFVFIQLIHPFPMSPFSTLWKH